MIKTIRMIVVEIKMQEEDFIIEVYSQLETIALLRDIIRAQRARIVLLELTVQEMHVASRELDDGLLEIDKIYRARYLFNHDVKPEYVVLAKEKPS